jgi:hypothetical protein
LTYEDFARPCSASCEECKNDRAGYQARLDAAVDWFESLEPLPAEAYLGTLVVPTAPADPVPARNARIYGLVVSAHIFLAIVAAGACFMLGAELFQATLLQIGLWSVRSIAHDRLIIEHLER